jgi:hypothetical protein
MSDLGLLVGVAVGDDALDEVAGDLAGGGAAGEDPVDSQVVTQRDAHLFNTKEMSAAFREAYAADRRPLLIVGGPRFDESAAADLGVDRVFSRGTTPGEVASFIVDTIITKRPTREKAGV